MIRSATPVFALIDRFRREAARPGVDQWEAAGEPQQNLVETIVWAGLVTLLTAALSMWFLKVIGIEGWLSGFLVVPVTFALFHVAIVFFGVVADLTRSKVGVWMVGYSAFAGCLIVFSEANVLIAWVWLGWMAVNAVAWLVNGLWKISIEDSR